MPVAAANGSAATPNVAHPWLPSPDPASQSYGSHQAPLPSQAERPSPGPHSPAGRPVSLEVPLALVPVALPEAALGTGDTAPAAPGQAGVAAAGARGPVPAEAVCACGGAKR